MTGPVVPGLGSLSDLKEVYLDRNSLSGSLPHTLTKLTKLESFRVNDNRLNGTVPAYLRARSTGLTDLQLWDNQFDDEHDAEEGAVVRTVNGKKLADDDDGGSTTTLSTRARAR